MAIMDPYGNEAALAAMAKGQCGRLRHGADAAHYARAGDGRAVQPSELAGYRAVIDASAEFGKGLSR